MAKSPAKSTIWEFLQSLGNTVLQLLFLWMTKVGLVAFIYLPVMFAVAIPLGLAREEKGVAFRRLCGAQPLHQLLPHGGQCHR
ncbi:hypothetical protein KBAH04_14620 [Aeromonas hydrophila]|nr:hypothetical protein KBAH04_14620 [Aeromonas hydrophila]